jgi:Tol biopolymer transport system component
MSPDGKIIAYDGGILFNLESGIHQVLNPSEFGISPGTPVNVDGPELVQPVWSPSGKRIVWLGHVLPENKKGTAIYLFDLPSHKGKTIYSFSPCYFDLTLLSSQMWTELRVRWSQDERFLAVISLEWGESSCENILQVFDKDSNIIQRYEEARNLIWSPDSRYLAFEYFVHSTNQWITLVASVNDWQLHPLDIPANATLIKW